MDLDKIVKIDDKFVQSLEISTNDLQREKDQLIVLKERMQKEIAQYQNQISDIDIKLGKIDNLLK